MGYHRYVARLSLCAEMTSTDFIGDEQPVVVKDSCCWGMIKVSCPALSVSLVLSNHLQTLNNQTVPQRSGQTTSSGGTSIPRTQRPRELLCVSVFCH